MVDNINHPAHYQTKSGLEVIDIIAAVTEDLKGEEAYDIGNAEKYISRYKKKNGNEDLKKAVWYLQRVIDINEKRAQARMNQIAANAGLPTNVGMVPPVQPYQDYHQNPGGDPNVV